MQLIAPFVQMALIFALAVPIASAEIGLGALVDSGARKLSPDEFKEQLAQTVVIGRTVSGGNIEVMYATNGVFQGVGTHPLFYRAPVWKNLRRVGD